MSETAACEHGMPLGGDGKATVRASGVGFCRCCRAHYGYIDIGWGTVDLVSGEVHSGGLAHPQDLCRECGGEPVEEG